MIVATATTLTLALTLGAGVGYAWRGVTGHGSTANRVIGEYLNMCYFLFYAVIALTYVIPYVFRPRRNFELITTGLIAAYLLCLGLFPLLPTAGPCMLNALINVLYRHNSMPTYLLFCETAAKRGIRHVCHEHRAHITDAPHQALLTNRSQPHVTLADWQYPLQRPPPEEVGYFFSYVAQSLVKSGSSIGTAFPSSHCAVTTVSFVLSMLAIRDWRLLVTDTGTGAPMALGIMFFCWLLVSP